MGFLRDETGGKSSARLLLVVWTILSAAVVARLIFWWPKEFPVEVVGLILTFLSGIELGLIGWAGGARIASYLMPQIGSITSSIKDGVSKFTKTSVVSEASKSKKEEPVDESTASTDISELSQKG